MKLLKRFFWKLYNDIVLNIINYILRNIFNQDVGEFYLLSNGYSHRRGGCQASLKHRTVLQDHVPRLVRADLPGSKAVWYPTE